MHDSADFLEGQLLVIVKRDDFSFVIGKFVDGASQGHVQFDLMFKVGILLRGQKILQGENIGGLKVSDNIVNVVDRDVEILSDEFVGGSFAVEVFELVASAFVTANFLTNGNGHPIHRAEEINHRAADANGSESFKFNVSGVVEAVDSLNQTEETGREEVVLVDMYGQSDSESVSDEFDEREIKFGDLVTHVERFGIAPRNPEVINHKSDTVQERNDKVFSVHKSEFESGEQEGQSNHEGGREGVSNPSASDVRGDERGLNGGAQAGKSNDAGANSRGNEEEFHDNHLDNFGPAVDGFDGIVAIFEVDRNSSAARAAGILGDDANAVLAENLFASVGVT